jgi:hypothetical protein
VSRLLRWSFGRGEGRTDVATGENQLLENTLDALDRLYDRHSSVLDLWALLFATAEALRATRHFSELEEPVAELLAVVRSGLSEEVQRDRALAITDRLRHYLAELLPVE